MSDCIHVKQFGDVNGRSGRILEEVRLLESKDTFLRCGRCQETSSISICLICLDVYCKSHLDCGHPLFINASSNFLQCIKCDKEFSSLKFRKKVVVKISPKLYKKVLAYPLKGIFNLGNTCYINSVLQVFLNCYMFRRDLLSFNHSCPGCLYCDTKNILTSFFIDGPVVISDFIFRMWKENNAFASPDHQDAHEFLISFFNGLHKSLSSSDENCECVIHKNIYGSMESVLECRRCGYKNKTEEKFMSLSLGCGDSLEASLKGYMTKEILQDKIFCKECKENETFSKRIWIRKHPNLLALQYKRFQYDGSVSKINKEIFSPPFFFLNGFKYQIYAFIEHIGSVNFGHYVAYLFLGDNWYKFDDDIVKMVDKKDLNFNRAYLAFYTIQKEDTNL